MMNNCIKTTQCGWIDLSNIPMNAVRFDWDRAIGATIPFQYKDIISVATIVERKNQKYVYIDIPGYVSHYAMHISQIVSGGFGTALGKINRTHIYNIGDSKNNLLILDAFRKNKYKYYKVRCLVDGYEFDIREDHIQSGHHCPVCACKKVLIGVNDIATTRPDVARLFANPDDAYNLTECSPQKRDFVCPCCGTIINAIVENVSRQGLGCKKCGDGFSYPNKFMFNVLDQILKLRQENQELISFETEKTFEWSKNITHSNPKLDGDKKYDFYVQYNEDIIIECHGAQHYEDHGFGVFNFGRTLEEEKENDKIKTRLALDNGINQTSYIVVDCRKSEMEFIKKSILNSGIPKIFDFNENDIDWNKCEFYACTSLVKIACDKWNNGIHNTRQISNDMGLHVSTVRSYLRRGSSIGICDYGHRI